MTVRQFIHHMNPDDVLSGKIVFKVIKHTGGGNKWFFYNEDKNTKTIDEFCDHEGIKGCMDLVICNDGYPSIEATVEEYDPKNVELRFHLDCVDMKEWEQENKDNMYKKKETNGEQG